VGEGAAEDEGEIDLAATNALPSLRRTADASGVRTSPDIAEAREEARGPLLKDVLRAREASRTGIFYKAMIVMTGLASIAMPFLPGPVWLRAATGAIGGLAVAILLVAMTQTRDPARYSPTLHARLGVALVALGVAFIYYLGLYSASATLFTVGIYFYAANLHRRGAWAVYATCAGLYFLLTGAIALDLVPDLSLFSVKDVPRTSRVYRVIIQQVMYAVTFYLARSSRRSTHIALERVQRAEQALGQREAQLEEAKGELDRALHAGQGRLTGELLGRYRLGAIVGRGGIGEVYAASHVDTGQAVAVKLLHPNMLEDAEAVERFIREASAAAQVPNPYVARVFEVGRAPSGMPFIIMELLHGHDLGWYLRATPTLPLEQVVELVEHCAIALSAVRDAGIVHRDLKPANLFLTDSIPRAWKVLDFGLSKVHGNEGLTRDKVIGTPAYMSPEQVKNRPVDHLADLYGLAAVAYRAITGRPPFEGTEVGPVLLDVLYRVPAHPGELVKLPVDVELVLAMGLAKDKADRFARVEEFASGLRHAASGDLDDAIRAKGWALLKQHPWGSIDTPTRRARR
jgi:hypothetical protein